MQQIDFIAYKLHSYHQLKIRLPQLSAYREVLNHSKNFLIPINSFLHLQVTNLACFGHYQLDYLRLSSLLPRILILLLPILSFYEIKITRESSVLCYYLLTNFFYFFFFFFKKFQSFP